MEEHSVRNAGDIKGKRVLLRLGLNVPIEDENVADPFRIDKVLPTVLFLKEKGARIVIAGHIGRSKDDSLLAVSEYINEHTPVRFIRDIYDPELPHIIGEMNDGDVIMLENLRKYDGEKENSKEFTEHLASLADIYVNDAFAVAHREHASITGVPKILPSYFGLQFEEEIRHLSLALSPKHPFLFVLGGAKFETKLPLMQKFLEIADHVFVGGALANTFFKARGVEVGKSRVDETLIDIRSMLEKENLILPTDVVVKTKEGSETKPVSGVGPDDSIMDAGPETVERLSRFAKDAELIVWNGPFGNYEEGFDEATKKFLAVLAESGKTTILGGGDTVALVSEMGIADKFTFVSTGGGAMLDFLADGRLPGVDAVVDGAV